GSQGLHKSGHRRFGRRIRCVTSGPGSSYPDPQRSLFGYRHRIIDLIAVRLGYYAAALVEDVADVGIDRLLMVDEPSGAVLAAFFFIAGRDEDDIAIEQNSRPLDRQHRHQEDNTRSLIVDRSASPDFSVF